MDFKLIDNWLAVLKYGWSIRFNVLAATSAAASAMLPYTAPDSPAFAVLSAVLAGCAALFAGLSAFSRVVHQDNVHTVENVKR
jgi:hypothetical protein